MGVMDLAIVLHSHMPYVEGFGTYPFGEEWLFGAFATSYLPVLGVAERLTMSAATAKTHVSRAMIKVGARDRAQLVVFAYESGLARPGWRR